MTKKFSSFALGFLTLIVATFSILSLNSVQAEAASSPLSNGTLAEINTNNINLREAKCGKVINTLKKGFLLEIVNAQAATPFQCKINGKMVTFQWTIDARVITGGLNGTIALNYLTKVGNINPRQSGYIKTDTPGTRLNIRQAPCGKVIGTAKHNSDVKRVPNSKGELDIKVCTLRGQRHAFAKVNTAGKTGYVSTMYLKWAD